MFLSERFLFQRFGGTTNYYDHRVISFAESIDAEFIRVHPLKAESKAGSVVNAMMRVNAIVCYENGRIKFTLFENKQS